MKLINMTDFVLEQELILNIQGYEFRFISRVYRYAKFLKQPLELWMFVPCHLVDGVWKILEYPDDAKEYIFRGDSMRHEDLQDYRRAKERCLFDDWKVVSNRNNTICIENKSKHRLFLPNCMTIENIAYTNSQLTKTAQKQLGL